jgi:peptide/nickel transport system substrate-binding protein
MPARIATTDPFKPITEYIGSGPMHFVREEWLPGARAVFEKFADYAARQEPHSWLSGGKRMLLDRIEWVVMPDPGTASAALRNGEVDWWETPIADLLPVLKKNRNVMVDIADPLGSIGSFRMNHLHPPFNEVRARRAILTAMSQEDYMRAVVGDDDALWKPLPSFFTPGTTPARSASIRRPIPRSARTARRRGWAGRPARRSKPRSPPGTRREFSTKRRPQSRLNKAAFEDVVYAPTGFFLAYQAWRKPIFWGVSKAA